MKYILIFILILLSASCRSTLATSQSGNYSVTHSSIKTVSQDCQLALNHLNKHVTEILIKEIIQASQSDANRMLLDTLYPKARMQWNDALKSVSSSDFKNWSDKDDSAPVDDPQGYFVDKRNFFKVLAQMIYPVRSHDTQYALALVEKSSLAKRMNVIGKHIKANCGFNTDSEIKNAINLTLLPPTLKECLGYKFSN